MGTALLKIKQLGFLLVLLLAFNHASNAEEQPNQFGAFIGGFGDWYAYLIPSKCHLAKGSVHTRKLVTSFRFGDESDFIDKVAGQKNPDFFGPNFDKIKELLRQVCVLKNPEFSLKNAKPDFVMCSRDEPTGRIVLWDWPAVSKEGFLSVDNKIIDGLVFTTGNGYRRDFYESLFGHEGKRYLDMYKQGDREIYTQLLIDYGRPFWYECSTMIEVSACRRNFNEPGFDSATFNKIFTALDGLWSNQFCKMQ